MSMNLEGFNQDLLLEINLMENFLEVVIYEQSVLASTEIDNLENILQIKADLINELLLVSNNRLSNLAGLGFPEKNSSMTLLIKQSTNVKLEQQWQNLIKIGSQADEINKNNGYIVNGLFFSNQKSLAFLQGKTINSLYGPDGRS
ncbi:MAG: flagellar protein FlgN [Methylococcaceae bacterium]